MQRFITKFSRVEPIFPRYFIGFRDPATPELLHKSKLESLVDMDFPKLINIGDV